MQQSQFRARQSQQPMVHHACIIFLLLAGVNLSG
jgi:hypothetical protein